MSQRMKLIVMFSAALGVVSFQNCSNSFDPLTQTLSSLNQQGEGGAQLPPSDNSDDSGSESDPVIPPTEWVPGAPSPRPPSNALGAPCSEANYSGFHCLDKELTTNEGRKYKVKFRWNRVTGLSEGTVVFLLGADGRGTWRDFPQATPVQESLNQQHQVRSIEIQFLDAEQGGEGTGYFVHGGGYYSAASAYMEALRFIQANLKVGTFMNHVGGSNGSVVAAYALSHFDAEVYIDRFVFHAGPFLPYLRDACNPNHFASFTTSGNIFGTLMSYLGVWAANSSRVGICNEEQVPRLSLLGNGGKSRFPRTGIHVVMGELERVNGFGNWIMESNHHWYSQIEAAEKTRRVLSNLSHEMDWSSVVNDASKGKPKMMGNAPTMFFSNTRGGGSIENFKSGTLIYGTSSNLPKNNTVGCMQEVSQFHLCDDPRNWSSLPNGDWSYIDGQWKSQFKIGAPGTYIGFQVNTLTGQRSPQVTLKITP